MAEEVTEFKSKSDLYERELAAAKKELQSWQETGQRVVKRYLGGKTTGAGVADDGGVFNLFWSNINILKAALYAKQPRADVSRRHKDAMDDVARVGGLIIERILNLDMDSRASDFDSALRNAIEDRLVPGMGQLWLRYEPTFVNMPNPDYQAPQQAAPTAPPAMPPQAPPMGMPPQGMPPQGPPQPGMPPQGPPPQQPPPPPMTPAAPVPGPAGAPPPPELEVIGDEHVATDYVYWRDFLYSPCRTWRECRWVARGVWMTRGQLKAKFGEDLGSRVPLQNPRGVKNSTLPENDPWSKAQVWEIWSKEDRYVCWKVIGFDQLLGEQSDPLGLTDFFPCPKPLVSNVSTTAFIPKADYQMLRDQYVELDVISARIALLEDSIRVAGVYDKSSAQIQQLISNRVQNIMIPADNWAMFAERGGIKGAVDWFPLDMVISALDKLREVKGALKQDLYDLTGLSDIMRGATVASETATAQQLKAQYGSVRMQFMQGELAEFVQSALAIKAEIMAAHFQPETLIRRSLIDKTPDMQYVQPAIQLLRDKRMAIYSLAVDPDTMAMVDYAAEQEARTACITAVATFVQAVWPLAQAKPDATPFLLQILQWLLAGFKAGKQIEGVLDQAIGMMQQQPPQGQQQQQPDPRMVAAQADAQGTMMKAQADVKSTQMKTAAKIQSDRFKLVSDAKNKQMKTLGEAAMMGLPPEQSPGGAPPQAPPAAMPGP